MMCSEDIGLDEQLVLLILFGRLPCPASKAAILIIAPSSDTISGEPCRREKRSALEHLALDPSGGSD